MASAFSVRKFKNAISAASFIRTTPISLTATTSIKPAKHSGRTIRMDAVAGFTNTLPASSGSGNRYRFVAGTTLTSGSYIVKVANATDVMVGGIFINDTGDTTAATVDFYPTAATSDTITLAQSVGAGKQGDWIEVEDVKSGFWAVTGVLQAELDPSTPFSATV